MGNHEYCSECGQDDFHSGQPCNPLRLASHQAKLQQEARKRQIAQQWMEKALKRAGIHYDLDSYGNAIVRPFEWKEGR